MASGAKRLKLSRRKNYAQLEITQTNNDSTHSATSTTKSSTKFDHNQFSTFSEPTVSISLQNLRQKLKECLPTFPDWRKFSGFPELKESSTDIKPNTSNDENHFATKHVKETEASSTSTSNPSTSTATKTTSVNEKTRKNPFIQQCPLCPIFFPHDWTQQEIQTHVSGHLDSEEFD